MKIFGLACFSVSQSVSQYVCSNIFRNSVRTAGPIGTDMAPFDALKCRNDDGACHEAIGGSWHVACAAAYRHAIIFEQPRSNGMDH